MTPAGIQRNYIVLTLLNTLSTSVIWGINTIFLLDAGLNNFEAFLVNSFFTAGMVLFEIPTGVVADTVGRQTSYLLGAVTLMLTTFVYYFLWKAQGSIYLWLTASLFLGLGFTFFSGAIEAWVVDALNHFGYQGSLDDVFAKAQVANGVAMLTGASFGGWLAQTTSLGVPYLLRSGLLILSFLFAWWAMKDWGFKKRPMDNIHEQAKGILFDSIELGFTNRKIRWMILTSPFIMGAGFYAFYAAQPYLLELYGNEGAYSVAGLAASLVAGAQIVGGLTVRWFRNHFKKRTNLITLVIVLGALALMAAGTYSSFAALVVFLSLWSLLGAIATPVRQSYLNSCLPSEKRATLLSFDGLMGSTGGVVFLPTLGRVADFAGYGVSLVWAGVVQLGAVVFLRLANREKSPADDFQFSAE